MVNAVLILGYLAMTFSSAANLPQVAKVFGGDGRIDDVSLTSQSLFMVSSILWTTYAGLTAQWALLANSVVVFLCNITIFIRVLVSRSSR